MSRIARLTTRLLRAPLARPWGPAVPDLSVIAVEVDDDDGAVGHGFSWTPTIGAASVRAMLEEDIRRFVVGRPTDPATLSPELWAHLHEAGGSGVTTIAAAGLDLALWDLDGRRRGRSLAETLGRRRESVPAYGSGVNLHYPLDELAAQAERWVGAGFGAVKVKVGSPAIADDVERLRLVRDIIGPDRALMIDANQRWELDTATRALEALAVVEPAWIEEPLRAEDLAGHRALRARTHIPIALGENLHTAYRFQEFLEAEAVDIVQPNVVRVGGITPFLEIARRAESAGATLHPHLLPEVSAQLALTLPAETSVEVVEGATFDELGILSGPSPLRIDAGVARVDPRPGLGLEFGRVRDLEEEPAHA